MLLVCIKMLVILFYNNKLNKNKHLGLNKHEVLLLEDFSDYN